jgi:hypothetical protein
MKFSEFYENYNGAAYTLEEFADRILQLEDGEANDLKHAATKLLHAISLLKMEMLYYGIEQG